MQQQIIIIIIIIIIITITLIVIIIIWSLLFESYKTIQNKKQHKIYFNIKLRICQWNSSFFKQVFILMAFSYKKDGLKHWRISHY